MVTRARIVCLPGDGIGPEVMAAAKQVLTSVGKQGGLALEIQDGWIGGAAHDRCGEPLDPETAVRAVYAYGRVMDHNAGFLEAARKMLDEKGLATPAGMAVLIRG